MSNEKFLDYLVVDTINLKILRERERHERADAFLLSIGYDHKRAHIAKVLNARAPVSQIPRGPFYVITPTQGMEYLSTPNGIVEQEFILRPNPQGVLERELANIVRYTVTIGPVNKRLPVHLLFFNSTAKEEFIQKASKYYIFPTPSKALNVTDYGIIVLYRVEITPLDPPSIWSQLQQSNLPFQ